MKTLSEFRQLRAKAQTCEEWRSEYFQRLKDSNSLLNNRTPKREIESTRDQIHDIIAKASEDMPIAEVFHPAIAKALLNKARSMPAAPEFMAQPLLTIAAGLLGTKVNVKVKEGYREPMVFWGAFVGEPGTMKSPAMKAFVNPLIKLQAEAAELHEAELAQYEADCLEWDAFSKEQKAEQIEDKPIEPILRDYYLEDLTIEGAMATAFEPGNESYSILSDELSSLIEGLDQYKGKGNDRQRMLSWWNGGAMKRNLVTKKLFVPRTAISICGGIQGSVIDKLMNADKTDGDGLLGRFCISKPKYVPPLPTDFECDISKFLSALYRNLDTFPESELTLSDRARSVFYDFQRWLAQQHPKLESALQNAYAKMRGYAVRLAGLLHCLDSCCDDSQQIGWEISESVMLRSIRLCAYFLKQVRLIRNSDLVLLIDGNEDSIYKQLLKVVELSKSLRSTNSQGWVNVRDLVMKHWCNAKTAREWFQKLSIELGIGETRQNTDRNWDWRYLPENYSPESELVEPVVEFVELVEPVLSGNSTSETCTGQEVESFVEFLRVKRTAISTNLPQQLDEMSMPPLPKARFRQTPKSSSTTQQNAETQSEQDIRLLSKGSTEAQQRSTTQQTSDEYTDFVDGENGYGF